MSLPSGYKRLEYIESSGTQYIDTWFVPNQDTRVVMDCYFPNTSSTVWLFGARVSTAQNFSMLFVNSKIRTDYYIAHEFYVGPTSATHIDKNKNVTTVDGEAVTDGYTPTSNLFSPGYSMFLFSTNDSGTAKACSSGRVKNCKIYDNAILVRDFIPCQTSSGEVGLWDDVNSKFYSNAGTGAFTAGPVAEYAKLEYIESTGSQYIDTGASPTATTKVFIELMPLAGGLAENAIFGSSWSATGYFLMFYQNKVRWHSKGASVDVSDFDTTGKNTFETSSSSLVVNGTSYSLAGTGSDSTYNIHLFSCGSMNGYKGKRGIYRLFACKIYDNDTLVRDYIPVQRVDGTVGLLDRANFVFCPDAAGVGFVAGPVIPDIPGNFRQTSQDYFEIGLAWDASEGATGYNLYKDGALIYTGTDLSYLDTQGYPSTSYIYQVTAFSAEGEGDPATLEASTKAGWAVIEPVFLAASISPNPVDINQSILISVQLTDAVRILEAETFYSGELYAGEV